MAVNTLPVFKKTGKLASVEVKTANANLDGTGTIETLLVGGEYGTLVELIRLKAAVTTTAGVVRLFVEPSGGSTFLLKEILVSAVIPSGTAVSFSAEWEPTTPLVIEKDMTLYASTENAESIMVHAFGGEY